jgi:hypothetical protein
MAYMRIVQCLVYTWVMWSLQSMVRTAVDACSHAGR